MNKFDSAAAKVLNEYTEGDIESPKEVLSNLKRYIEAVERTKSFGFNKQMSMQAADQMMELVGELKNSISVSDSDR